MSSKTSTTASVRASPRRWRASAQDQVTWGVDAQRNRYYRPVYTLATGERFTCFSPDVTLDTLSDYGQLDWNVGERLRVSTGVRHEEYGGSVATTTGPLTIARSSDVPRVR